MNDNEKIEELLIELNEYIKKQDERLCSLENNKRDKYADEIKMIWNQIALLQQLNEQVETLSEQNLEFKKLVGDLQNQILLQDEGNLSQMAGKATRNNQEQEKAIDEDATLLLMENRAHQSLDCYCPVCRNKVEKDMLYCIYCGTKL